MKCDDTSYKYTADTSDKYVIPLDVKITKIFHPVIKRFCIHTITAYSVYLIVYFGLYNDQIFYIFHIF